MEKYIHEPTDIFNFNRVSLKTPFSCGAGGGIFSKFVIDGEPFYIKTPKCTTKQGFIKSGKRTYCDLVFSIVDDEDFIRWMENLVTHSQTILLEKSSNWFQYPINENEIEDAIISPLKSYRAGKYYLVQCNVPLSDDGSPEIKAYDENAREISLASIHENMDVVTLLEIRGIKCAMKSFQFEINIKQIMAVKKINILETCLLSSPSAAAVMAETAEIIPLETAAVTEETAEIIPPETAATEETAEIIPSETAAMEEVAAAETAEIIPPETAATEEVAVAETAEIISPGIETPLPETEPEIAPPPSHEIETASIMEEAATDADDDAATADLEEIAAPNTTELEEVNLEDLTSNELSAEPIVLKNPNELYYNMYFDAKNKAKEARMNAITAYLEAKNIKMLYDLDDVDDSEEEDDFMDFIEDDGDGGDTDTDTDTDTDIQNEK